jgi:hypothetical protein
MSSVLQLIHLPSRGEGGIDQLAQAAKLSGRGSMTKAEKIIALADEQLSEEAHEVILAANADLVQRAREAGIDGYSALTKSELQERFLKNMLGEGHPESSPAAKAGSLPRNGPTRSKEVSPGKDTGASSSCSEAVRSDDARRQSIREAAHRALDAALAEKRSYVVIESFRPKDKAQPLSIQPAYMQRHEDTHPVCEILIPHLAHRR